jgi:hypothetical protein
VGRSFELAEIEWLLARAAGSRVGGFVLITGEPGIGKTALAEQAISRSRQLGFDVAWATCWQTGVVPPLQPWTEVLESLAGDDVALPDLHTARGDVDAGRVAQGDAVRRWLRQRQGPPMLIVLDDLQWADAATVSILSRLAGAVRGLPVVLVGTHRPVASEPASALASELAALQRQALGLELRGLDDGELIELVTVASGRVVSAGSARSLHVLTGGNPLFARELSRLAVDGIDWSAHAVPTSVQAIVGGRVARLEPGARDLLELLSVIGDEASVDVMAELADRSPADLLAALDEPRRLGLVRSDGSTVAFVHDVFRIAVYESQALVERVARHDRVARGLLARRGRGQLVTAAALAHHFGRAASLGNRAEAARFALEAAGDAVASLAFDVAVRRYEQVLALLDVEPDVADRLDVLAALADARLGAGDGAGARHAFRAAAELAQRVGGAAALGRAALGLSGGLGGIEVTVRDGEAIGFLRDAVPGLADDDALGARVEARLSVALSHTGTVAERSALAAHARERAEAAGDPVARAEALAAWCDVHSGPAHVEERRLAATTIVSLAGDVHDGRAEALGRRLLVEAHLEAGDLAAAEAEAARYAAMSARLGRSEYGWYPSLWRAALALARGDLDARRRWRAELGDLAGSSSSPNAELLSLVHDAIAALELAERGFAPVFFQAVEDVAQVLDDSQLQVSLARFHLLAGDPDRAGHVLDRCLDRALASAPDSEWPATMMQAAEVVVGLGGHRGVGLLRAAIEPFAATWVVEGLGAVVRGPFHRALGALAAVEGDVAAANRHFDAAREAARRCGAEGIEAVIDHEAGLLLGDRAALERAAKAWRRMGAAHRLAELRAGGSATIAELVGDGGVPADERPTNRFVRHGDVWTITFAGATASLRDRKGLADLARLLAEPHRELAALDLAAAGGGAVAADLGDVIDADAREAYKARLRDLDDELTEADAHGDAARSARLAAERDALVEQLVGAYGLGGRARRSGGSAERARTAVRSRLRDALDRIAEVNPELGRHLRRSVRTGTFCVYDPDPHVVWDLGRPSHTV